MAGRTHSHPFRRRSHPVQKRRRTASPRARAEGRLHAPQSQHRRSISSLPGLHGQVPDALPQPRARRSRHDDPLGHSALRIPPQPTPSGSRHYVYAKNTTGRTGRVPEPGHGRSAVGNRSSAAEGVARQRFPNSPLYTHEGRRVRFYDDLIKGKLVVINMMYAQCEGICPKSTTQPTARAKRTGRAGRSGYFHVLDHAAARARQPAGAQ